MSVNVYGRFRLTHFRNVTEIWKNKAIGQTDWEMIFSSSIELYLMLSDIFIVYLPSSCRPRPSVSLSVRLDI